MTAYSLVAKFATIDSWNLEHIEHIDVQEVKGKTSKKVFSFLQQRDISGSMSIQKKFCRASSRWSISIAILGFLTCAKNGDFLTTRWSFLHVCSHRYPQKLGGSVYKVRRTLFFMIVTISAHLYGILNPGPNAVRMGEKLLTLDSYILHVVISPASSSLCWDSIQTFLMLLCHEPWQPDGIR